MSLSKEELREILHNMMDYVGYVTIVKISPNSGLATNPNSSVYFDKDYTSLFEVSNSYRSSLDGCSWFTYKKENDTLVFSNAVLDNYHRLTYKDTETYIEMTEKIYKVLIEILKPDFEKAYLQKTVPDPYSFFRNKT